MRVLRKNARSVYLYGVAKAFISTIYFSQSLTKCVNVCVFILPGRMTMVISAAVAGFQHPQPTSSTHLSGTTKVTVQVPTINPTYRDNMEPGGAK